MSGEFTQEYCEKLEIFMVKVASMTKCLPSYADPSPAGDNKHIIESLKLLIVDNETLRTEKAALAQALENFVRVDDAENKLLIDKPGAIIAARQVLRTLEI